MAIRIEWSEQSENSHLPEPLDIFGNLNFSRGYIFTYSFIEYPVQRIQSNPVYSTFPLAVSNIKL
jgi:hypothetical protein